MNIKYYHLPKSIMSAFNYSYCSNKENQKSDGNMQCFNSFNQSTSSSQWFDSTIPSARDTSNYNEAKMGDNCNNNNNSMSYNDVNYQFANSRTAYTEKNNPINWNNAKYEHTCEQARVKTSQTFDLKNAWNTDLNVQEIAYDVILQQLVKHEYPMIDKLWQYNPNALFKFSIHNIQRLYVQFQCESILININIWLCFMF